MPSHVRKQNHKRIESFRQTTDPMMSTNPTMSTNQMMPTQQMMPTDPTMSTNQMMPTSAPLTMDMDRCYNNLGNKLMNFTIPAENEENCIRMIKESNENNKLESDNMKLCLDNINQDVLTNCFVPRTEPFRQTENSDEGKMSCGKILCILVVIFLLYMLFKGNTKNKTGMKQHLQYFFF